jgi:biotin carboxyl carrier protein
MKYAFAATVGQGSTAVTHEVSVEALGDGRFRVTVGGRERIVDACRVAAGTWSLLVPGGGPLRLVDVDGAAPDLTATVGGVTFPIKLIDARRAAAAKLVPPREKAGPQPVRAPMPGKVVKVLVRPGETVKAGQGVVVVEAMKMENELRAPRDGTVGEVAAREGQAVDAGQVLATIG